MKKIFLTLLWMGSIANLYSQKIQVMTYNIRYDNPSDGDQSWSHRKDFLARQIQFYAPDILGIQEALPHQISDLRQALPSYGCIGQEREGNGQGESANIYFKTDRFVVLQYKTFWLSETPEKASLGWDAACKRICTYGLFEDRDSQKKFWVFNTHLDHQGQIARNKSVALILETIRAVNTQELPVILMGDFNTVGEC